MISKLNKFKIPTLLGLAVILAAISFGVFSVVSNDSFTLISRADPKTNPQNIIISNIDDQSATISFQTQIPVTSFITYQDKASELLSARLTHYFTLTNLTSQSEYSFKITTGKQTFKPQTFKTAAPPTFQNGFGPIVGVVFLGDEPLDEGIAYLSIKGAVIQSSPIKSQGNFLIPLSYIRKEDLSDTFAVTEHTVAKITIISSRGEASALFNPKPAGTELPPIKIGQAVDLISQEPSLPAPSPTIPEVSKFDLNGDGLINANDHAIVLQNFGPLREASKNPKNIRADLNGDGVVNKKDLDLISKQINQ